MLIFILHSDQAIWWFGIPCAIFLVGKVKMIKRRIDGSGKSYVVCGTLLPSKVRKQRAFSSQPNLIKIDVKSKIITFRVYHIEMNKVNWLWQMDRLRFSISYLRWPIQEVMTFGFYQPVFKKVTLAGLNSLWQKRCQISVKNWIFNDPFHTKGLVLIIWVLRMIKSLESVFFLMKWGYPGHWGHWGRWGHWGHWGWKGFKA